MTYNEFWLDNPYKVVFYRKSFELKTERKKYENWELGAYFYESLVNTSVLFRDLAKKGSKPEPYPKKPYGIEEIPKTKEEILEEQENERLKAEIHFKLLFKQLAKKFENKVGE